MRDSLKSRRILLLPGLLGLLALGAPGALAAPGPSGCGTVAGVSGVVELCDGTLFYRDYLYDDYGAAGGGPGFWTGGLLSYPSGAARYPTGTEDNNFADLVQLSLRIEAGMLHVSFLLNSLYTSDQTVAALAIDTDDDAATGGGFWADLLASIDATAGVPLPLTSGGWDELHLFETGDPATNRIEGSVPLPPGTRWRLQAVTGRADTRQVMNVAFRGTGQTGRWFEDEQSNALSLAGGGNIDEFGAGVEVADLLGATTASPTLGPGFYGRIYESDFTVALDPNGAFVYDTGAEGYYYGVGSTSGLPGRRAGPSLGQYFSAIGRYQPYGVYIPPAPGPHGLQLALHGYTGTHTNQIEQPGMQARFGDDLGRVIVTPLARGPLAFYSDASERDVLDVLDDVRANYPIDDDRIVAGGYSMGGYGAFLLATLYPHRFAGLISWVGYPGDGCLRTEVENQCPNGAVANVYAFFDNLRSLPAALLYADADQLVNAQQGEAVQQRFAELLSPHVFWLHQGDHFTLLLADDWAKEAAFSAPHVREPRPPHVTYRMEPWAGAPELGIRHDRAYWVRDLRGVVSGEDQYVIVDALTFGCGGVLQSHGLDPPSAGSDPVPWTSQSTSPSGATPIVAENRIELTLGNVESLTIDVDPVSGACLGPGPIAYEVTTGVTSRITFSDGRSLLLPPGTHTGEVAPQDGDGDGLADPDDNCPFFSNATQADSGSVGAGSPPDGIGDACQCGDVDDDGVVVTDDAAQVREALAARGGGLLAPDKCNVAGPTDAAATPGWPLPLATDCDVLDVVVLRRTQEALAPELAPVCARARP